MRPFVFGTVLVAATVAAACATRNGTADEHWTLAGQITYRERIMLPAAAIAVVQLVEAAETQTNATPIAEDRIAPTGQVPIRFELDFAAAAIDTAKDYALRARIEDGAGRVLFHTARPIIVEPASARTVEILLNAASTSTTGGATPVEFACDALRFSLIRATTAVASLVVAGDTFELAAVEAASGARYRDSGTEFWNRGDSATLTFEGNSYECRVAPADDPWVRARAAGVDIRAVGQEPGWLMDLYEGDRIELLSDYGARNETFTGPVRSVAADGTVRYTANSPRPLEVAIDARRCADGMSGEPYAYAVTVIAAGDTLRGCGRRLN